MPPGQSPKATRGPKRVAVPPPASGPQQMPYTAATGGFITRAGGMPVTAVEFTNRPSRKAG